MSKLTILSVDQSTPVRQVMALRKILAERGLAESTLVLYGVDVKQIDDEPYVVRGAEVGHVDIVYRFTMSVREEGARAALCGTDDAVEAPSSDEAMAGLFRLLAARLAPKR